MNVESQSTPSSQCRCGALALSNRNASNATLMPVSDLVAAVESGKYDLDGAISMEHKPLGSLSKPQAQYFKMLRNQKYIVFYSDLKQKPRVFTKKWPGTNCSFKRKTIFSPVGMVCRIGTVHYRQTEGESRQLAPERPTTTTLMLCALICLPWIEPVWKSKQ